MSTRWNRVPKPPPIGISERKPKSRRWCGRIPRSNTRTSRTPTERSIPSAHGGSTSTGLRSASLTGHSSLCDKESEQTDMRTVVVDGPRSIRVETRPDPTLSGRDGAVVEVTPAGICGSYLQFYDADFPLAEPITLGHEAVGTVVEIGSDVRTVKVGDQVMVSSVTGCGACPGCATRDPVRCYSGFQI